MVMERADEGKATHENLKSKCAWWEMAVSSWIHVKIALSNLLELHTEVKWPLFGDLMFEILLLYVFFCVLRSKKRAQGCAVMCMCVHNALHCDGSYMTHPHAIGVGCFWYLPGAPRCLFCISHLEIDLGLGSLADLHCLRVCVDLIG